MIDPKNPRMRPESRETVHAVANAIELGVAIMERVSGGDISSTLSGTQADKDTYRQLIASTIRRKITNNVKGGK